MDLYRILRVSLYGMVAAGAFAISLAEHNFIYIVSVLLFGVLAYQLMDKGRGRPVREHYFGAMTLALWLYHFPFSIHESQDWNRVFLSSLAHFLCSFQVLLFFRPYRDFILLVSGVSTLAVLIISGVLNINASLLLRIAVFMAITAWTLFIHSMWRARETFAARRLTASRGAAHPAAVPDLSRTLPERAFWQGLSMMTYLSASCLALGLFLFFSTPRLEKLSAIMDVFMPRREIKNGTGRGPLNRGGLSVMVGFSEQVNINDMGPLRENNGLALTVTFSPSSSTAVDAQGRIFLRSMAMSRYVDGIWASSDSRQLLEADDGKTIEIIDPTAPALRHESLEIKQVVDTTISNETLSNVFFAVAPISRIGAPAVEIDAEGVIRRPNNEEVQKYEVWSHEPVHQSDLPPDAVAEHPNRQRYIGETGLRPDVVEDVRRKALSITANDTTSLQKVRSIVRYLRDSGEYSYTLKLNELQRKGDPIAEFLLSPSTSARRGHCGYFASAFVVLCRMSGIPARMASGFASSISEQADPNGNKIVFKHSDAHAWGEVYFRDFGWVPFDATPAARGANDGRIAPDIQNPIANDEREGMQDAWSMFLNYDSEEQRQLFEKIGSVMKIGLGSAEAVMTGRSIGGWVIAAIAWLGAGFFILWLTQLFLRRGRQRIVRSAGGNPRSQAALSFYNDLLQVLQRRGFVRKPGQTPREFAEHVVRHGGSEFQSVLVVTRVFESVRYGGEDISQDDFNLLQSALDHLRELTFASTVPAPRY